MVRPLARRCGVGAFRIQGEALAPVLQGNARAGHHHARTKTGVIALDVGDHIAFVVRRAEIDGARVLGIARGRLDGGLADELPPGGGIFRREHFFRGHFHIPGIGDITQAVDKSQLGGFDLPVDTQRIVQGRGFKAIEDVEGHQGNDPLAVGRQLPHLIAMVGHAERLYPLDFMLPQIFFFQKAAELMGGRHDSVGNLPLIIVLGLGLGDGLQGIRQIRVAEQLSRPGRFPSRHKNAEPLVKLRTAIGIFPHAGCHGIDAAPGDGAQSLTFPGIGNGGG